MPRKPLFKNSFEWILYGILKDYNKRNPKSLERSINKEDRYWYSKGIRENG